MYARNINTEDCKAVYAGNVLTDEVKQQAREYLEQGYWLRFGASCLGHTRAEMIKADCLKWARAEFPNLETAMRKGYSDIYCRLTEV